jgi:hypothetical protein
MANTNNFYEPIKTLYDTFTIFLCNRDHNKIGILKNVDFSSIHLKHEMANGNEVSFDVYYELDGEKEPLWDSIVDLKLIFIPELKDFLEITITDYDSVQQKKSIVGVNAGIAELSQTQIYGLEINTPEDLLNDDNSDNTDLTVFYNADNPKKSLLNRILYKIPQYTIGHVPESVAAIDHTFSVNDKSVWEFLSKDVAEAFDVLFVIDNVTKTIHAYDLLIVCNDCHTRQQPYYEFGYYDDPEYASDSDLSIVTDEDNAWLYGKDSVISYKRLTCKECGSHDLSYFGEDTHVLVDKDNLTDEITLTIDTDNIKNTFKLEAGDDLMTATVVGLNPNGSQYINKFNEIDYADMPDTLVEKLNQYEAQYDSYKDEYAELMEDYYDCLDNVYKYKDSLMPTQSEDPITAETEAAKLTVANLSPAALTRVGEATTVQSVNGSLVQLAKVFVKTGYVKVEVDMDEVPATFTYIGLDANNHHYGTWTGRFIVTNYSDPDDTAPSALLTIIINDDYETYLDQKIAKNIVRYDDKEGSIYEVLKIVDIDEFKDALTYYCVKRLESFRDALSNCLNILIQEGHGTRVIGTDPTTGSDVVDEFYDDMYVPYRNKLDAVEEELPRRQSGLEYDGTPCEGYDGYGEPYATANVTYWANIVGVDPNSDPIKLIDPPNPGTLEYRKREIQEALNLENFLGETNYKIFCAYRREGTYSNSNYISTGFTNAEMFENAQKFLDAANEELLKASTPQYTVKCNLYNLLPTDGYEYFREKIVLGNWIRVIADNQIFRLRLLNVNIDFSNFNSIDVEFSNVTKIGNIMTDVESILNSAKSMATSYGATENKADSGEEANSALGEFVQNGLLSSLSTLKNNVDEEITISKYGIYAKSFDPDTGSYSPEQLRITHNVLVFTNDNWQSAKAALGKHEYTYYDSQNDIYAKAKAYGLTAEFVQAGHINGSTIIGGDIYSENYSSGIAAGHTQAGSHINLNDGTFSFGGGKLTYNGTALTLDNGTITAGTISGTTINNGNGTFQVAADGAVTAYNLTARGTITSGSTITGATISGGEIKVPANTQNPAFYVNTNGVMSCSGAIINGNINNGAFSVTAAGVLTATSGTIGGWTLGTDKLYSGNVALESSGNITCKISNQLKWGIYNNGDATFNNITINGGTIQNAVISDYVTTQELNAYNVTINGRLDAAIGNIGELNADKANIEDLTTGTLVVQESVEAQTLNVSGTVTAAQLTAGVINGHHVSWQAIRVGAAATTSDKSSLWKQSTSPYEIVRSTTQPSGTGWNKLCDIVMNIPTKLIYILAEDNA